MKSIIDNIKQFLSKVWETLCKCDYSSLKMVGVFIWLFFAVIASACALNGNDTLYVIAGIVNLSTQLYAIYHVACKVSEI